MKRLVWFGLKSVVLTLLLFVLFSVSSLVVGLNGATGSTDPLDAGLALLGACALYSVVLGYPIVRSRWSGWPLVLTVMLALYGVMTFLSQIETVVFLKYLVDIVPAEMIPKLFMQGLIIAVLFSPLAVLVHGKVRSNEPPPGEPNPRLVIPPTEWAYKLLLISVIYVLIYVSFGMFVFRPLAGSAFDEYYRNLQLPGWVLFFQMARALVWVAIALPVIRMMKGAWWEASLAVALLFSVLMGALLLVPTEIMPVKIRMAHLVEVTSSNFLFGWVVAWLLTRPGRRPQAKAFWDGLKSYR